MIPVTRTTDVAVAVVEIVEIVEIVVEIVSFVVVGTEKENQIQKKTSL